MMTMRSMGLLAATGLLLPCCQAASEAGADDATSVTEAAIKTAASSAASTDLDIISPAAGSTVPDPVWLRAHLTECNGKAPISFGYSIDDESAIIQGVTHYDVDTTIELSSGTHTVRYKAWTSEGICPVLSTTFTVHGTTDGITVSSPANDADVTSPVHVEASVATCGGAKTTAFGYSVDSASSITWGTATAIDAEDTTIPSGVHVIHFKAWAGGVLCPVIDRSVTVAAAVPTGYDGSASIPTPPSTATLSANLDDLSSWSASTGAQSSCPNGVAGNGCDPPNANFNRTVQHVADPGSAPAGSDGTAGLFELDNSPAWATCIWGHSFETASAARSFIWDFYVLVTGTDYQSSELDFYQILGGQRFMMGTQCNRSADSWDTWNEGTQHWVHNTSIPCNTVLTPNAWHHVIMYLTTDATTNEYTYKTFRIDDVDYVLNQAQPTHPSTWPNGLVGVQVQLDANASGEGVNEYVEAMKAYSW